MSSLMKLYRSLGWLCDEMNMRRFQIHPNRLVEDHETARLKKIHEQKLRAARKKASTIDNRPCDAALRKLAANKRKIKYEVGDIRRVHMGVNEEQSMAPSSKDGADTHRDNNKENNEVELPKMSGASRFKRLGDEYLADDKDGSDHGTDALDLIMGVEADHPNQFRLPHDLDDLVSPRTSNRLSTLALQSPKKRPKKTVGPKRATTTTHVAKKRDTSGARATRENRARSQGNPPVGGDPDEIAEILNGGDSDSDYNDENAPLSNRGWSRGRKVEEKKLKRVHEIYSENSLSYIPPPPSSAPPQDSAGSSAEKKDLYKHRAPLKPSFGRAARKKVNFGDDDSEGSNKGGDDNSSNREDGASPLSFAQEVNANCTPLPDDHDNSDPLDECTDPYPEAPKAEANEARPLSPSVGLEESTKKDELGRSGISVRTSRSMSMRESCTYEDDFESDEEGSNML